jgi:hypothetical protein
MATALKIPAASDDSIYDAVHRSDFPAMMETGRYMRRSHRFDEIIARTDEHYWNPDDRDYIDFSMPWDMNQPLVPDEFAPELKTAFGDQLDERQKVQLINENARWSLCAILHGEQGALNLSASLCDILIDPAAQEYAANQAREEARHVHAFSNYIAARFGGRILPVGETLGKLLDSIVKSEVVYEKIVGMQMLVEGLAMGAFTTLHTKAHDPLLRRTCQLVMTDEAFHHKFGKLWAQDTMPRLNPEQHAAVEHWAAKCFNILLFNLVNPEQKKEIYSQFGLDWQWVNSAMMEAFTDADRRANLQESTNLFRVLIKTLLKAGIITDRTRSIYAAWVDMNELAAESEQMAGNDIAEDGIRNLKEINAGKRKIVRKIT